MFLYIINFKIVNFCQSLEEEKIQNCKKKTILDILLENLNSIFHFCFGFFMGKFYLYLSFVLNKKAFCFVLSKCQRDTRILTWKIYKLNCITWYSSFIIHLRRVL